MNDLERVQHWQQATRQHFHSLNNGDDYFETGRLYWESHLAKVIKPSDVVLEFGSGDGRIAKFVQCRELWLTDVSHQNIQAAIANAPHAKVFRFDRRVDVMFAANVFIHMTHSMIEATLFYMARFARRFAIQMPLYDESREGIDWIDVTTATPVQWIQWCDLAGLDVIELHASKGSFAWDHIGPAHRSLQILEARA